MTVRSAVTDPNSLLSAIQHVTGTPMTARTTDGQLRERDLRVRRPLCRLPFSCAYPQCVCSSIDLVLPGIPLTAVELISKVSLTLT